MKSLHHWWLWVWSLLWAVVMVLAPCPPGFIPPTCETSVCDTFDSNACLNGGSGCHIEVLPGPIGVPACDCLSCFTGTLCEEAAPLPAPESIIFPNGEFDTLPVGLCGNQTVNVTALNSTQSLVPIGSVLVNTTRGTVWNATFVFPWPAWVLVPLVLGPGLRCTNDSVVLQLSLCNPCGICSSPVSINISAVDDSCLGFPEIDTMEALQLVIGGQITATLLDPTFANLPHGVYWPKVSGSVASMGIVAQDSVRGIDSLHLEANGDVVSLSPPANYDAALTTVTAFGSWNALITEGGALVTANCRVRFASATIVDGCGHSHSLRTPVVVDQLENHTRCAHDMMGSRSWCMHQCWTVSTT